jgi:hypothetical protein
MRVILLDGFPGTGKSVTAQQLALRFDAAGQSARWFHEREPAHPLGAFRHLRDLLAPGPESLAERLVASWRGLGQPLSYQVVLLDGSLLNLAVGLLVAMNTPRDTRCAVMDRIAELLARHDAMLVYLAASSTDGQLNTVVAHRGSQWSFAMHRMLEQTPFGHRASAGANVAAPSPDDGSATPLLREFWAQQEAAMADAYDRWPLPKATCTRVGDRWRGMQEEVAVAVGAPPWHVDPLPLPALARCVGAYRGEQSGRRVVVTTDGHALYLQHADAVTSPLVTTGAGRPFLVEGLPCTVHFHEGEVAASAFRMVTALENDRVTTDAFLREPFA